MFLFGIFLLPNKSFACGMDKTASCCCKKENATKPIKKECTKKAIPQKNKNTHDDCDGKCNHSSCQCSSFQYSNILPFLAEIKVEKQLYFSKKTIFPPIKLHISSGFISSWLLPKIS